MYINFGYILFVEILTVETMLALFPLFRKRQHVIDYRFRLDIQRLSRGSEIV